MHTYHYFLLSTVLFVTGTGFRLYQTPFYYFLRDFPGTNTLHTLFVNFALASLFFVTELLYLLLFRGLSSAERNSLKSVLELVSFDLLLTLSFHFQSLSAKVVWAAALHLSAVFLHFVFVFRADAYIKEQHEHRRREVARRLSLAFFVLLATDLFVLWLRFRAGPLFVFSVRVFFFFEHLSLLVLLLAARAKHAVVCFDEAVADGLGWPHKFFALFVIDLARLVCEVCIESCLFFALVAAGRIPLQVVRKLYATAMRANQKVREFVRHAALIRQTERSFEDIDLRGENALDKNCPICFEEVDQAKVLPCGHFFHLACLRRWLETGKECPVCRADIATALSTNRRNLSRIRAEQLLRRVDVTVAKDVLAAVRAIEANTATVQRLLWEKENELALLRELNRSLVDTQKMLRGR